ncbi:hypothetical protein ACYATP_07905 [Lactobacillaceae bacterium Melli_B4]
MQKWVTKIALTAMLFGGVVSSTGLVTAKADQAAQTKSTKPLAHQADRQINQYMKLLHQSSKTDLIKELINSGRPSSISELGSKVALHSDNQAASNGTDAKQNAIFYLKLNRILNHQINHSYQCDDGNKLSSNLKDLKATSNFNNHSAIEKVAMTGMGIGDSLDFGNRTNN